MGARNQETGTQAGKRAGGGETRWERKLWISPRLVFEPSAPTHFSVPGGRSGSQSPVDCWRIAVIQLNDDWPARDGP